MTSSLAVTDRLLDAVQTALDVLVRAAGPYGGLMPSMLDRQSGDILARALDESKSMVADANRRIEAVFRDLREKKGSREAIVEAKAAITETVTDIEQKRARIPERKKTDARKPVDTLEAGMDV